MKYILLFAIILFGTNIATAQKGLKMAEVNGGKLKAISASKLNQTMFKAGSGLKSITAPIIVSKGKNTYVQFTVANRNGETATSAFSINRANGFTQNFKYVCSGGCSGGKSCKFTYDGSGRIDGCDCCELDIERVPIDRFAEKDFGF